MSSFLGNNLGTNCQDSSNQDLVVVTLKSIGNIGYYKNLQQLVACIENKSSSLETRVSAIQAFRRFSCDAITQENVQPLRNLLQDQEEDTEVRINAFQIVVQCTEHEKFLLMAKEKIPQAMETETNMQVNIFFRMKIFFFFFIKIFSNLCINQFLNI